MCAQGLFSLGHRPQTALRPPEEGTSRRGNLQKREEGGASGAPHQRPEPRARGAPSTRALSGGGGGAYIGCRAASPPSSHPLSTPGPLARPLPPTSPHQHWPTKLARQPFPCQNPLPKPLMDCSIWRSQSFGGPVLGRPLGAAQSFGPNFGPKIGPPHLFALPSSPFPLRSSQTFEGGNFGGLYWLCRWRAIGIPIGLALTC